MKSEDVKVYYIHTDLLFDASNKGADGVILKSDFDTLSLKLAEAEAKVRELERENNLLKESETCGYCDFGKKHQDVVYKLQTANAALEQRVNELEYVEQVLRKGLKESQESDFNHRMEITTLEQKVKSLEEEIKQDYCDNAKRERELVTKLAVAEAKLKKAVEQRDKNVSEYLPTIEHARLFKIMQDDELAAITAESIAKTEGEK